MIHILTIILSSLSLLYELAYTNLFINLFGNDMFVFSMIVGIYMFFLGVGTYIEKKLQKINLGVIEVLISLTALAGLWYIVSIYAYYNIWLALLPPVLIGVLSGIELPLLIKLSKDTNKTIAYDYFGAVVGTIIFNFYLFKYFNPTVSIVIISLTNFSIGCIIFFYLKWSYFKTRKTLFFSEILTAIFLLSIIIYNSHKISTYFRTQFLTTKIQKRFPIDKNISIKFIDSYKTIYQQVDRVKINYSPLTKGEYLLAKNDKEIELNKTTLSRECLFLNYQEQNCKDYQNEYAYFLYKEPLKYIHKRKLNILVLGGGDIYDLTVIPLSRINEIVLIDIDKVFIKKELKLYSKQIKPYLNKLHIVNMDATLGIRLLAQDNYKFDYIIYDLPPYTDRIKNLSNKKFFYFVNKILKKQGLFVSYKFGDDNKIKNITQYFKLFKKQVGYSFTNGLLDYSDIFLYFKK